MFVKCSVPPPVMPDFWNVFVWFGSPSAISRYTWSVASEDAGRTTSKLSEVAFPLSM